MNFNKLNIIYQDEDIIAIDKEAGMLSIGDRFSFNTPSLLSTLRKKLGEVFVVHRLDKDTSGVIVFALNKESHAHLSKQFESRETSKSYIAFVDGLTASSGTIDEPIAESPFVPGDMVVHKKGKPSITHYKTLGQWGDISKVEIDLETGRTHQIRVHFKYIGHPLFIDDKYGRRSEFYLSAIKGRKYRTSKGKEERPLVTRLTLHAQHLSFKHPKSLEQMTLSAPLPKDLRAFENQLEKVFNK